MVREFVCVDQFVAWHERVQFNRRAKPAVNLTGCVPEVCPYLVGGFVERFFETNIRELAVKNQFVTAEHYGVGFS